jgi:uncharacterized protein
MNTFLPNYRLSLLKIFIPVHEALKIPWLEECMKQNIVFTCLQTPRGRYIYDRHTNSVFAVSQSDFLELKNYEEGDASELSLKVIAKYQDLGLLLPSVVKKIEHSASDILVHCAHNRISSVTLQLTQQCNLRCSYCSYSGNYHNTRVHSSERMSFEIARKAIDMMLANSRECGSLHLGFYGGEPLLEFDLLKKCVEYITSHVNGKKLTFGISTNGTLLNNEIVTFFREHNFTLSISLDGSKEEHDVNRKFANGQGSFNMIFDNISSIKQWYPDYMDNVHILTTINPKMDLGCVLEYFKTDEIFSDTYIIMGTVNTMGLISEYSIEEKYTLTRRYEFFKFLMMLTGKLDKKYVSSLFMRELGNYKSISQDLHRHIPLSEKTHHGGPCMPGIQRLFVSADGKLFPCEKVSETSEYCCIGHVNTGFDTQKMQCILNIGHVTEKECKSCWNLRRCSICVAQIDNDNQHKNEAIDKESKLRTCALEKNRSYSTLYDMCVLHEVGSTVLQEGRTI